MTFIFCVNTRNVGEVVVVVFFLVLLMFFKSQNIIFVTAAENYGVMAIHMPSGAHSFLSVMGAKSGKMNSCVHILPFYWFTMLNSKSEYITS